LLINCSATPERLQQRAPDGHIHKHCGAIRSTVAVRCPSPTQASTHHRPLASLAAQARRQPVRRARPRFPKTTSQRHLDQASTTASGLNNSTVTLVWSIYPGGWSTTGPTSRFGGAIIYNTMTRPTRRRGNAGAISVGNNGNLTCHPHQWPMGLVLFQDRNNTETLDLGQHRGSLRGTFYLGRAVKIDNNGTLQENSGSVAASQCPAEKR
jgi:hypothetical protein